MRSMRAWSVVAVLVSGACAAERGTALSVDDVTADASASAGSDASGTGGSDGSGAADAPSSDARPTDVGAPVTALPGDTLRGNCEADGRLWVEIRRVNGRLEVEIEMDETNTSWEVALWHGEDLILRDEIAPEPGDDYAWVESSLADRQGDDLFTVTATRLDGGDDCALVIVVPET